jgi:hypothetical protein
MLRKERLLATLNGFAVDRPAVSFYEINGLDEDINNPDPFNIYNHPSWIPIIHLAREKTDRIVMRSIPFINQKEDPIDELTTVETFFESGTVITRKTIKLKNQILYETTRRDREVNTTWHIEHLLKNVEDIEFYLSLPHIFRAGNPDISDVIKTEEKLGDSGIVMIDTPDPICLVASLFDLGTFSILATYEEKLIRRLLDLFEAQLLYKIESITKLLPGRLWRIYGPEYASPPYLSPKFFQHYVTNYDRRIVNLIHENGGYARIHSHGNLRLIIDEIVNTGCDGLDPIEPPPQGDMELIEVRKKYGQQLVLFGNLEASDLENLDGHHFELKVRKAIQEGTYGSGRGFVLMPSSCPYGRTVSLQTIQNYEKMITIIEQWN